MDTKTEIIELDAEIVRLQNTIKILEEDRNSTFYADLIKLKNWIRLWLKR